MAWAHSTAVRNAATDAVVDAIDAGSTNASGKIIIYDAGNNVLVELAMSNPAFGSASNGTATAAAITNGTASAAGTADHFEVVDRDETMVMSGDVGDDLVLDNTSIANGQTVSVSSFTYAALVQ